MEKFAGQYELVKQENFIEYLTAIGVPKERIEEEKQLKQPLSIAVDGKKVTLTYSKFTVTTALNETVEKTVSRGTLKIFSKLDGENFVQETTSESGSITKRIYSLSGSELTVKITDDKSGVPEATRVYKKL